MSGWAVSDEAADTDNDRDAASLCDKLERMVLPLHHGDRGGWCAVMKGAIIRNASFFNSHRMMRR